MPWSGRADLGTTLFLERKLTSPTYDYSWGESGEGWDSGSRGKADKETIIEEMIQRFRQRLTLAMYSLEKNYESWRESEL